MNFGDFFWMLIWTFFFVAYLIILFQIITDLFRDHMSGWFKALWVVALFIVPFLSALIYLIVRGRGMAERHAEALGAAQQQADARIRQVAGNSSSTEQIATAKGLLESGAISQEEFDQLKQRALAT